MTEASKVVRGVPTEPDVERLRKQFPPQELHVGQIITFETVETILNREGDCAKGSHRFRTVTGRWRDEYEALYMIRLGAERGVGFKVLNSSERLVESSCHLKSSFKQAIQSNRRCAAIPANTLTEVEMKRSDHILAVSAKVIASQKALTTSKKRTYDARRKALSPPKTSDAKGAQ